MDGQGLTKKDTEKGGVVNGGNIGTGDKAIAFKLCRNILIRDVTIYRGGHFGIILTGCELGTVDNVTIDTNRDGFDIDCCKYLSVSNCKINTPRDDALVLKSSYALKKPVITEHIAIINCVITGYKLGSLLDGSYIPEPVSWVCGRFKLGTESNGGYKNISLSNCTFMYSSGLAFEEVDQGIMENVTVSNITMNHVHHYPIYITTGCRNRGPKERTTVSFRTMKPEYRPAAMLVFIFCFSLFLILVFFFMLFPNPAVLFLHHPVRFPVLSLLACQP